MSTNIYFKLKKMFLIKLDFKSLFNYQLSWVSLLLVQLSYYESNFSRISLLN